MKYLAMLLLVMACRSTPIISIPIPGFLGVTVCDASGNPVIVIAPEVLGTKDAEHVLVHEETHAKYLRMDRRGCAGSMFQYTHDRQFKIHMEKLAYCAEGEFMVRKYIITREDMLATISRQFATVYDTAGVSCDSS